MTLSPIGTPETAIELAAQNLVESAAFRNQTSSSDATHARRRVVLRWGGDVTTGQAADDAPGSGDPDEPEAIECVEAIAWDGSTIRTDDGILFAKIDESGPTTFSPEGVGVWGAAGSVTITLMFPIRPGLLPWEIIRYAGNISGAIANEINDRIGAPGGFADAELSISRPVLPGPADVAPAKATVDLTITWS